MCLVFVALALKWHQHPHQGQKYLLIGYGLLTFHREEARPLHNQQAYHHHAPKHEYARQEVVLSFHLSMYLHQKKDDKK